MTTRALHRADKAPHASPERAAAQKSTVSLHSISKPYTHTQMCVCLSVCKSSEEIHAASAAPDTTESRTRLHRPTSTGRSPQRRRRRHTHSADTISWDQPQV